MSEVILNSVSKYYGKNLILNNFSLKIEKGERLVILGPSGCGKTTILRLIAGFIPPDKGSVVLHGKTVSENGKVIIPPEKRRVGMIFQDLALWPHFTVKENMEFGLKYAGFSKKEREIKISKMLEIVDMKGFEDRKPAELSGGQQQRVALARTLIIEPEILLADEPLNGLDFDLNEKLRKEIVFLQEELKFTLIYVTHNKLEADYLATETVNF